MVVVETRFMLLGLETYYIPSIEGKMFALTDQNLCGGMVKKKRGLNRERRRRRWEGIKVTRRRPQLSFSFRFRVLIPKASGVTRHSRKSMTVFVF